MKMVGRIVNGQLVVFAFEWKLAASDSIREPANEGPEIKRTKLCEGKKSGYIIQEYQVIKL